MNWLFIGLPLLGFYLIWFGYLLLKKKYNKSLLLFALAHFPYLLVNLVAPFRGILDSEYAGYQFGLIHLSKGALVPVIIGGVVVSCFVLMTKALQNKMGGFWKFALPVDAFLLIAFAIPVVIDLFGNPAAMRIELGEYLTISGYVVSLIITFLFLVPTAYATLLGIRHLFSKKSLSAI